MKVAVIGSGIAGLGAAYTLAGAHEITMFEAAPRPGGHVYTVDVDGIAVDMGFIVHNREHYPGFSRLLRELKIETRPTTMAFSVVDGDHEWGSGSLSAMFADRRKLLSGRHWRFLARVLKFLNTARHDFEVALAGPYAKELFTVAPPPPRELEIAEVSVRRGPSSFLDRTSLFLRDGGNPYRWRDAMEAIACGSLDDYLAARQVSNEVREHFVIPLAAALWSLAPDRCGAFPAITYFAFLDQHGMLSPTQPIAWRTIVGGSRRYVDALIDLLHRRPAMPDTRAPGFELELATPVRSIVRDSTGVALITDGGTRKFDRVIVATHADTALALLAQPTAAEQAALGAIRYSTNRTVLHTDRSFLPRFPAAHASWNYVADPDTARVNVTYSMSRLQGLPDRPYLVTLNPRREPRGILHEVEFAHPQFDRGALAARTQLEEMAGTLATYYCGAHFGFGFHEDGWNSGEAAAMRLVDDLSPRARA